MSVPEFYSGELEGFSSTAPGLFSIALPAQWPDVHLDTTSPGAGFHPDTIDCEADRITRLDRRLSLQIEYHRRLSESCCTFSRERAEPRAWKHSLAEGTKKRSYKREPPPCDLELASDFGDRIRVAGVRPSRCPSSLTPQFCPGFFHR